MKKRSIIKKYEKDMFPITECELDPYYYDLINEPIFKKINMDEGNSGGVKRHTLRNEK